MKLSISQRGLEFIEFLKQQKNNRRRSKTEHNEENSSETKERNQNPNTSFFLNFPDSHNSVKDKTRKTMKLFSRNTLGPTKRKRTFANFSKNSSILKLPTFKKFRKSFLHSVNLLPKGFSRRKSEKVTSFKIYKECVSALRPDSTYIKDKLKLIDKTAKKKKKLIDIKKKISKDLKNGRFSHRSLTKSGIFQNFKTSNSLNEEMIEMERNKIFFDFEVNRRGLKDFDELHSQIRSVEKLKKLEQEHILLEKNFKKRKNQMKERVKKKYKEATDRVKGEKIKEEMNKIGVDFNKRMMSMVNRNPKKGSIFWSFRNRRSIGKLEKLGDKLNRGIGHNKSLSRGLRLLKDQQVSIFCGKKKRKEKREIKSLSKFKRASLVKGLMLGENAAASKFKTNLF